MSQTKVEAPFVANNANFKNLIINGDMQIAQRTASATASGGNSIAYTTLDRFGFTNSLNGGYTSAQTALSAADQATTGQVKTLDIQCTTADTSILAADYAAVQQKIEAQNCQHLLWGTSAAKKLTVSFYIKSNLTGTTCGTIVKNDSTTYYYPFEFTINSANTWEKKSVVIEPDSNIQASAGAIANDNGVGLQLFINLTLGSNLTGGTNRTWTTSEKYATSNQLNFLSSTDNDLFLTGVQLEVGDQATDFEHLPIDIQLQRCRRYFQMFSNTHLDTAYDNEGLFTGTLYTNSAIYGHFQLNPNMRTTPALYEVNGTNYYVAYTNNSNDTFDDLNINSNGSSAQNVEVYVGSGDNLSLGSGGQSAFVRTHNNATRLGVDAEL
jgi:hypothetical protein